MANLLQDIAALGTTPIPGDSPTGTSARYEPEYEQLQLEIEKLQSVNQTPVDWGKVVSLSNTLLSQKTKDMLLAAYLTAGLLAEEGYPGLTAGLNAFKDLLATHWDKCFPPVEKMRGRESAVSWLNERAGAMTAALPDPSEGDREALAACMEAIEAFKAVLSEKFTDSPVSIPELAEKIQDKINAVPEPPPPPAEEAPADASAASPDSSAPSDAPPAETVTVTAPAEIDSPDRVREEVGKAVAYLRGANPGDPLAFELERVMAWTGITEAPEPMPAGADAGLLPGWETGLRKKEYQRVFDEAQAKCLEVPLWLDPQLYVVRAMEGLGPAFDAARAAVTGQVAALIVRAPDLLTARFEGDVPAASEVTAQWIRHEVLKEGAPKAAGEGDRIETALSEARKLATRGKLPAATALVQKELMTVPPGRSRFLWRLNLARLCADSGKPALAVPQLEALDAEAERGALESWEPELAVEVVKTLWQCYSSLSKNGGESMADKASRAYSRLCRLDLTAAMTLDGKK